MAIRICLKKPLELHLEPKNISQKTIYDTFPETRQLVRPSTKREEHTASTWCRGYLITWQDFFLVHTGMGMLCLDRYRDRMMAIAQVLQFKSTNLSTSCILVRVLERMNYCHVLININKQSNIFSDHTYMDDIPQWTCANFVTDVTMYIPINRIVGTMVTGPMKRSRTPTNPVAPTKKWITPASIRLPCNCSPETALSNTWHQKHQRITIYSITWLNLHQTSM